MVQQVASVKTESAATSLPFNFAQSAFSGSSDSFSAFSSELMRQTKQVSNEPARQVANRPEARDLNSNQSHNSDRVNNERSSFDAQQDYHQKQAELRERRQQNTADTRHEGELRRANDQQSNREKPNNDNQESASRANRTNSSNSESNQSSIETQRESELQSSQSTANNGSVTDTSKVNHTGSATNTEKTNEDRATQIAASSNDSVTKIEGDIVFNSSDTEPSIAELELTDINSVTKMPAQIEFENNTDDFDYVSFVSQIAQIKTDSKQETTSELSNHVQQANTDWLDLSIESSKEDTVKIAFGDEFSNVLIDKSALQKILDSKEVHIDLNAELNDAQLEALRNIISDMLNQMHQQTEDLDQEILKLDEELMFSLLLEETPNRQTLGNQEPLETVSTELGNQDNQDTLINLLKAKVDDSGSANLITSDDIQSETELKPEIVSIANTQHQQISDTSKSDGQKTNPAIASVDNKPNSHLLALAELNESQTQKAIDNISSRLQNVLSELSEPSKGNEFIAALQSNLKELKQQLAQGTETIKDLKNLISDALVSSGIDVSSTKQPKIDGVVNQFNAVLNLANNVNYSANLQQSQVLGITDLQYAKELNQQQIDGTKLANATNQANMQANADKAVNIFKQEGQAQLAEKVRWMVNSRNQSAEIRLDPPDLGGVNIRVNMNGDSAQVSFNVQSNAAKEALDQALPRLREMLQEQGIELGQSNVQQDSQQQQGQPDEENSSSGSLFANAKNTENALTPESDPNAQAGFVEQRVINGALGGVDYYA